MNLFIKNLKFWIIFGLSSLAQTALHAAPDAQTSVQTGAKSAVKTGTIPASVLQALARAGIPREAFSMEVKAILGPGTNEAVPKLSYRAEAPMNPASVMKLVTTFSALDILGPDFTWKTGFYTDGQLNQGVLNGNLIIKGGGDPKWVLERIEDDFKTLQKHGLQRITGDIVLDNSIFDVPPRNSADFDGEPMRPYNSAPDGLLVNFKALIFKFQPDPTTQTIRVTSEPPMADVTIDTQVTATTGPCGDWRSQLRADFSQANQVRFNGNYSARCGESVWPIAYIDPDSYATRVVKAMFKASGGILDGSVKSGKLPTGSLAIKSVYQAPSLPLSQIITDINKYSNNVMAQQVFLTLSAQASPFNNTLQLPGKSRVGSMENSRKTVLNWWRQRFGLKAKPPVLDNGSGLSRHERISANSLNALLGMAAKHPSATVFANSLSIAGVDGTVVNMAKRGIANQSLGQAQLKTGTLRDVAAIAGYATGKSGQRYSVVGIINHPNAGGARTALDALVEWTVIDE